LPVGALFPFCGGSGGRNRTFSNTIHFPKFIGVPPHLHTTTHIPFGKRREADAIVAGSCSRQHVQIATFQIDFRLKTIGENKIDCEFLQSVYTIYHPAPSEIVISTDEFYYQKKYIFTDVST
jgi:hypothetical protein